MCMSMKNGYFVEFPQKITVFFLNPQLNAFDVSLISKVQRNWRAKIHHELKDILLIVIFKRIVFQTKEKIPSVNLFRIKGTQEKLLYCNLVIPEIDRIEPIKLRKLFSTKHFNEIQFYLA